MFIEEKIDFTTFKNAKITGIDIDTLTSDEKEVLYTESIYCQGMVDADIETMKEIVPSYVTFTHMSGMVQTRDEYFVDIKNGRLNYYNKSKRRYCNYNIYICFGCKCIWC